MPKAKIKQIFSPQYSVLKQIQNTVAVHWTPPALQSFWVFILYAQISDTQVDYSQVY